MGNFSAATIFFVTAFESFFHAAAGTVIGFSLLKFEQE
jgi:hypothetical protein